MTEDLIFYSIVLLLLLITSAYFSASETALTAVSRARLYQLVMDGNKAAIMVSNLRRNKESVIGTVLLGNNAVNIAASVIATSVSLMYFGHEGEGLIVTTLAMTLLVVVFTEVLPKTYAINNAERVSLLLGPSLGIFVKLLYPITHAIQLFIRLLFKILRIDVTQANSLVSATDVLRGTIELHHREGQMIKQDRDMLGSILDLNDITVGEIMIHRKQVETIDADLPPSELISQAVMTMHSRIPLWRGEPDNIIGLLHVKSLVRLLNGHHDATGESVTADEILSVCIQPWFVPETTSLRDQLVQFRSRRQHFAFVIDEYGAWQGVVTLEDIIEEIVGDIDDEHDEVESDIQKAGPDSYYVLGSLSVRDLNRALDWQLSDEHASTVAGIVIHEAQTIPAIAESFEIEGFRFTVVSREGMQITRLRVDKFAQPVE
jgi:Mg2+/Co2+ transporter CorB